jgi:hypothetical protein
VHTHQPPHHLPLIRVLGGGQQLLDQGAVAVQRTLLLLIEPEVYEEAAQGFVQGLGVGVPGKTKDMAGAGVSLAETFSRLGPRAKVKARSEHLATTKADTVGERLTWQGQK